MADQYYAGDVPFRRHPMQILLFSPAKKRLVAAAAGTITTFNTRNGEVVAKYTAPRVGHQIQSAVQTDETSMLAEGGREDEDIGEYVLY